MSISEGDAGKVSGVAVGGAGVGGAAAESGSGTNLLIVIGIMAITAALFYLFIRHYANKENGS